MSCSSPAVLLHLGLLLAAHRFPYPVRKESACRLLIEVYIISGDCDAAITRRQTILAMHLINRRFNIAVLLQVSITCSGIQGDEGCASVPGGQPHWNSHTLSCPSDTDCSVCAWAKR